MPLFKKSFFIPAPFRQIVIMQIHRLILSFALAMATMALTNRTIGASPDAVAAASVTSPREHLLLDNNWKFHLGDDWPDALHLDKAGASTGPVAEKFSDQSWRAVTIP